MQLYDHILLREPEYLGFFDLIFSSGFLTIILLVWSPVIIYLLLNYTYRHYKNKKEIKIKNIRRTVKM